MKAEVEYYVSYGGGDFSESMYWEIELTPEEEVLYTNALEEEIALEDVEELEAALERAKVEIRKNEGEFDGILKVRWVEP